MEKTKKVFQKYMKAHKIGYGLLAEKCGLHKSTFYQIASGRHQARIENAYKICQATNWEIGLKDFI